MGTHIASNDIGAQFPASILSFSPLFTRFILFSCSVVLLSAPPASAISATWTGATSTDFALDTNWGGTAPTNDLTSGTGVFSGSVTTNLPTLTASRSISGLSFQSSGWSLNTGSSAYVLSIGAGGITTAGVSGSNTINAAVGLGVGQSWNVGAGNTLVVAGQVSGAGALTVGGAGTLVLSASNTYSGGTTINSGTVTTKNNWALGTGNVSVVGTTGTTRLLLQANLSLSTGKGMTLSGTTGASGILDSGAYTLTTDTLTINSGGVLQLSGSAWSKAVTASNVVVNSGGIIQSVNNNSGSYINYINGNVTLNNGATLTTNNGTVGQYGRIAIAGNFTANAGSTISDNSTGYIYFTTGSTVTINSGVTLAAATSGVSAGTTTLGLWKASGTTTLTSAIVLDGIYINDGTPTNTSYTAVVAVSATGQNIGLITVQNSDTLTTTTVKLGSDLTVSSGKGIIAQGANAGQTALDLRGYTYDASLASGSGAWAPNPSGSVGTGAWSILSSSGTGTFRAGSFNLTGPNTDVTIGSNVTLDAVLAGGTSDLGLKAGGSGVATIDSTSTFSFLVAGTHTLQTSGTYTNGTSRIIGNVLVGSGSSASTLKLGSAITTGTGSSVTVNQSSTLALGANNLTTNGLLAISGGTISASGGTIALGGDITASGTTNSAIGAAINTIGTASRNITVSNAGTSLSISNAIGGSTSQLTKLGAGLLTLGGTNTYTGATIVSAGELDVNGSLAEGSAVTLNASAILGGSGTVNGTVTGTSATINGRGLTLGATTLNGSSTLSGYNIASSVTINSGTTSLTGTTQSTGTLLVIAGATLNANGTIAGSASVRGQLSGSTTVTGNLALTSGTLSPGNSPGFTTVEGNFTMDSTSKLVAQVSGTLAGISYDQVKVSGIVTLDGTLDLTTLSGLTLGSTITLIDNTGNGTTTGYFSTIITSGSTYRPTSNADYAFTSGTTEYLLSYNTSSATSGANFNDVTLTVVPEPSTWAMIVGGLGLLVFGQQLLRGKNV